MPPSHGLTGLVAIKAGARKRKLARREQQEKPVRGRAANRLLPSRRLPGRRALLAAAQGHDGGAAAGRAGEFGLNAVHAAQAFASHHFIERASAGHMAAVRSGSPDTNFFRFFT